MLEDTSVREASRFGRPFPPDAAIAIIQILQRDHGAVIEGVDETPDGSTVVHLAVPSGRVGEVRDGKIGDGEVQEVS
jgi:hypothetical protein